MQVYLVAIIEEGMDALVRVKADSEEEARAKGLAHYNGVDVDEIDLDNAYDMTITAFAEDEIEG